MQRSFSKFVLMNFEHIEYRYKYGYGYEYDYAYECECDCECEHEFHLATNICRICTYNVANINVQCE